MRKLAQRILIIFLGISLPLLAEPPEVPAIPEPGEMCDVHGVPFDAIEVPISYGLKIGPYPTLRQAEIDCRYRIESEVSFPNSTPDFVDGGCVVKEVWIETHYGCMECNVARARWLSESAAGLPDAEPWLVEFTESEPAHMREVISATERRITGLESRGEPDVAACLRGQLPVLLDFAEKLEHSERRNPMQHEQAVVK